MPCERRHWIIAFDLLSDLSETSLTEKHDFSFRLSEISFRFAYSSVTHDSWRWINSD